MKLKTKMATAVVWVVASLLLGAAWQTPAAAGEEEPPPTILPTARLPMAGPRQFTPKEYLYYVAPKDAPTLARIIQCESGWDPTIKNVGSSATGLAQFLDITWIRTRQRMGLPTDLGSRLDPYQHIDALIWLYAHDGGVHWLESKHCWNP